MKPSILLIGLLAQALVSSNAAAQAGEPAWVPQARSVAMAVPPKLLAVLKDEIARGGPEGAITVCREQAPAMARAASEQSGWQVRRVSLRNRNPKAVPDAWERAALEDFDRRAAAGESPAKLERAELVEKDGRQVHRYMRALPTVACVTNSPALPLTRRTARKRSSRKVARLWGSLPPGLLLPMRRKWRPMPVFSNSVCRIRFQSMHSRILLLRSSAAW